LKDEKSPVLRFFVVIQYNRFSKLSKNFFRFFTNFWELHPFEDDASHKSLQEKVNDFEAQLIRQALEESQWNQSQAARLLGTAEYTIRYKMEKLGIAKPAQKRRN